MKVLHYIIMLSVALLLFSCSDIIYSAKVGNIDGIKKSLENDISIETKNPNGATPLIVAAYSRQPEAVLYLLNNGANINATDKNGCTPLIYAAYYNDYETAKVLIEFGADTNIKDRYGNTAHDYASQYEYTKISNLLEGSN